MNEPELLDGIERAMATTVKAVSQLESLLTAISAIGSHIEGVADQVNCMAMNVAVEALRSEQSGTSLATVAEEARLLEVHALKVLVEVSQRVHGLVRATGWPATALATPVRLPQ